MSYFQEISQWITSKKSLNELFPRSICSSRNISFVLATENIFSKRYFILVFWLKKTGLKIYRHLRVRNRIKMWKNILRFVLKKHTKVDWNNDFIRWYMMVNVSTLESNFKKGLNIIRRFKNKKSIFEKQWNGLYTISIRWV